MNVLTGEKIQILCDLFIGTREQICVNPFIVNNTEKHLYIDEATAIPSQFHTARNVFCYTDILTHRFEKLCHLLSNIQTPFRLFIHNSDDGFKTHHEKLLKVIPNIQHIYTQNIEITPTCNISPLPIGIANRMWRHGDLEAWKQNLNVPKTEDIYMNFLRETNMTKRQHCMNVMMNKNIPNQPNLPYDKYLAHLAKFRFAICPEGNGLDTHRFWECLYLKTIPICLKNPITLYFQNHFPLVLLDSWEELDTKRLHYPEHPMAWTNTYPLDYEEWKRAHGFLTHDGPKTHFLTFGAGDKCMTDAVNRLVNQARSLGIFNEIYGYDDTELQRDSQFWNTYGAFMQNTRGHGYWMWKPYLIEKVWKNMKEGDVLLYCDCGNELDIDKKSQLLDCIRVVRNELVMGCYPSKKREDFLNEISWCKRDVLIYMGVDNREDILYTNQYQANPILLYKCERTTQLVHDWAHITKCTSLIDDSPSVEKNSVYFEQHRHDQSIYSILCKKYGLFSTMTIDHAVDVLRNKSGFSQLTLQKLIKPLNN